jgi:negative modulator of initiation of replication
MKTIQVDDDVYAYLLGRVEDFGDAPNDVLKRELLRGGADSSSETSSETPSPSSGCATRDASGFSDFFYLAALRAKNTAVERFLYLLSCAHRQHPDQFENVLQISGRSRKYFARSAEELRAHGDQVSPKQIPDTPYWVVTNNSTGYKRRILKRVLWMLGYEKRQAQQALQALTHGPGRSR